jgi:hypothetical protein
MDAEPRNIPYGEYVIIILEGSLWGPGGWKTEATPPKVLYLISRLV